MRALTACVLSFVLITTPLLALDHDLDLLLAKLPNSLPEVHKPLVQQLAVGGEETLGRIIELIKEPGKGDDRNARYALHALARHAGAPGAAAYRAVFAKRVREAIRHQNPTETNAFLIQQLTIAGEALPSTDLLLHDALGTHIAFGISAVKPTADTFRSALDSALNVAAQASPRNRPIGDVASAAALLGVESFIDQLLLDKNESLRIAARRALAVLGQSKSTDVLLKGLESTSAFERSQALDASLLLARRLTEANKAADAEKIYRHLLSTYAESPHIHSAALHGLAQTAPNEKTLELILKAVESEHLDLQAAAMNAGQSLPGRYVTRAWLKQIEKSPPDLAARILELLAARGDPDAFDGVLALTRHTEPVVRHAAMRTAATLGAERAVPPLIEALKNDADRSAARDALARAPGKSTTTAIAYAIPHASPPAAKAALLNVLAARNAPDQVGFALAALKDQNAEVRAAAASALGVLGDTATLRQLVDFLATEAKADADRDAAEQAIVALARLTPDPDKRAEPLAAALPSAADMANRAALLRALGRLGGSSALPAIRDALKSSDPQVRDAGVRALSNWPTPDQAALGDLSQLARSPDNNTHRVLALRAYLRLAGQRQLPADKRLAMYRDGLALAKSAEDRRLALSGLADLGDIRALPLVAPLLEDPEVQQEAAAAIVRVTRDVKAPNSEARDVLNKVLAIAKDERVRRDARSRLQTLGAQ